MKKIKNNKGITLVALIITIIVLLILAVVAISAVNGDGIISKAKIARKNYQTAQNEENTMLVNYLLQIEDANSTENKKSGSVPYSFTLNELIEKNIIYPVVKKETSSKDYTYLAANAEEFVNYLGYNSLNEFKESDYNNNDWGICFGTLNADFSYEEIENKYWIHVSLLEDEKDINEIKGYEGSKENTNMQIYVSIYFPSYYKFTNLESAGKTMDHFLEEYGDTVFFLFIPEDE